MPVWGRWAGDRRGGSAGPAAACPRCRWRGWREGRRRSCSRLLLLRHGRAARAQPPTQLPCRAGTGPRELRRAVPAGRGGTPGPRHSEPLGPVLMAAVPRPPAHGRAREALEEPGALGVLRVAPRARGAGRQRGGRGGAVGFAPRRRGVGGLFILFSLQTISFRLCSLFSSFFEERDRFPRPPPLQHRDPRHATRTCPLEGHQAGQTPAHHLPRRVGRGAVKPPAPQPCHPLHRGGRHWDRCCSPPPSGRAMGGCVGGGDARPRHPGPFPGSQRARGPLWGEGLGGRVAAWRRAPLPG